MGVWGSFCFNDKGRGALHLTLAFHSPPTSWHFLCSDKMLKINYLVLTEGGISHDEEFHGTAKYYYN